MWLAKGAEELIDVFPLGDTPAIIFDDDVGLSEFDLDLTALSINAVHDPFQNTFCQRTGLPLDYIQE